MVNNNFNSTVNHFVTGVFFKDTQLSLTSGCFRITRKSWSIIIANHFAKHDLDVCESVTKVTQRKTNDYMVHNDSSILI